MDITDIHWFNDLARVANDHYNRARPTLLIKERRQHSYDTYDYDSTVFTCERSSCKSMAHEQVIGGGGWVSCSVPTGLK